jgi:hypothetical protein
MVQKMLFAERKKKIRMRNYENRNLTGQNIMEEEIACIL